MKKRKRTIRFKAGDLAVVRSSFKTITNYDHGPRIVGHSAVMSDMLQPEAAFLVLADAKEAPWRQNRKLYIEIMTPLGPRVSWAAAFRMRPADE